MNLLRCILSTLITAWGVLSTSGPGLALENSVRYVHADVVNRMGITGTGEVVGFLGIHAADTSHPNLGNLTVSDFSGGGPSTNSHATQVAGIVGSASNSGSAGVAPDATLISVDVLEPGQRGSEASSNVMAAMYALGQGNDPRATIWNMSLSFGQETAGASELARFLDFFTNTYDIVFTKSAGNVNSLTAPSGAFNIISVGATGHGSDASQVDYSRVAVMGPASFTSASGELSDGRSKPDIVAPGQQITSTSTLQTEATGNGTSFSAPHVAGAAALLRDFGDDWQKIDDHRVIKAILLNSADKDGGHKTLERNVLDKTGNTWMPPQPGADPLDEDMGAGQLNVMSSIVQYTPDEALAGFQGTGIVDVGPLAWDYNRIDANSSVEYKIAGTVKAGTNLTTTLVWDRIVSWKDSGSVPGVPDFDDGFVIEELANLDISIVNAAGNELILPDTFGRMPFSNSPNDTVEHIYFATPESGPYSIRVQNLSDHATTYGWALWVPEPSSLIMTLFGMLLIVAAGRRR